MQSISATASLLLVTTALGPACSIPPERSPLPPEANASSSVQMDQQSARRSAELAQELVRLMREGLETRTPNHSFFGPIDEERQGAPFDGSYDWHSAVIAHWALLTHARTARDEGLEDWTMGRLDLETLTHHAGLLERRAAAAASPDGAERSLLFARMTFPYDEGWFLMLLAERAKRDDGARLLPVRGAIEGRLLDALESRPFPENLGLKRTEAEEGQQRFCGFYGSSLFLYLQLRWAGPVTPEGGARLDAWRDETLTPLRRSIQAIEEPHGYDFLWPPALLALADQLEPGSEAVEYAPPAFQDWPESVRIATVHVLGMELSRVWPIASTGSTYAERVDSLLARADLWREDFAACSHWVPQFLFIGEWLRRGRP